MKTAEQIAQLKDNWLRDQSWDIEDAEGFEENHDELLIFRLVEEKKYLEKQVYEFEIFFKMFRRLIGKD